MRRAAYPIRIEGSRRRSLLVLFISSTALAVAVWFWRDELWHAPMGMDLVTAWSCVILFSGTTLLFLGPLVRPSRLVMSAERLEYSNFLQSWSYGRDQIDQIRLIRLPGGIIGMSIVFKPEEAQGGRQRRNGRRWSDDLFLPDEFEIPAHLLQGLLTYWLARRVLEGKLFPPAR